MAAVVAKAKVKPRRAPESSDAAATIRSTPRSIATFSARLCVLFASATFHAQTWQAKPIRIIVPCPLAAAQT